MSNFILQFLVFCLILRGSWPLSRDDSQTSSDYKHVLSRHKRFLAFPVGSSFSTAVCLTIGVLGNPNYQYLSFGMNWGIAYELPNATWVKDHAHGFHKKNSSDAETLVKRRHRREIYGKLETLIDNMGYNGRECVLLAICESKHYFGKSKMGIIGELLRVLFKVPKFKSKSQYHLEDEPMDYDEAFGRANIESCREKYDCTFSLLELALGKYSAPTDTYFKHY